MFQSWIWRQPESRISSYMENTVFTLTAFKRLNDVLLCSGCYIKIPQNRWLKQHIYFSQFWRLEHLKIKVPVNLVPGENPSGFQRTIFSLCAHMLERESSGVSFLVCVLNSSVVPDSSATAWTVDPQAPLSMGVSQERILQWVAISFSRGIFLTQGLNPRLLHLLHWQVNS